MEIYLLSIIRFSLLILSIAMCCWLLAFGLGTMIYNGLEFGAFFEVPPTSPCYQILQGVNPVLQMIFTFMQMYFIFMNSRVSKDKDCELCICSIFWFRCVFIPFFYVFFFFSFFFFLFFYLVEHSSIQSSCTIRFDARCRYESLRLDKNVGTWKPQRDHPVSSTVGARGGWNFR